MAYIGFIIILSLSIVTLLAPQISPYDPRKSSRKEPLVPPNSKHFLGTDDLGRDVFSQVLEGIGVSFIISIIAATTSVTLGTLVGAISGYYGGVIDGVLMRLTELFQTIPRFFMALVLAAIFGGSLWNIILVISLLTWPSTARITRANFLSLKERDFVSSAKAMGASKLTIIFGEILPNSISPIIVNLSLLMATAIKLEAGISFLGLGDPELISLGKLLYNARMFIRVSWWMAVFPGLALSLLVLGFNLIGDGLNYVLNPRLLER
jgi:peptide/nickel transport system permease protein